MDQQILGILPGKIDKYARIDIVCPRFVEQALEFLLPVLNTQTLNDFKQI